VLGKKQTGAFRHLNEGRQIVKKALPLLLLLVLSACASNTDLDRLSYEVNDLRKQTKTEVDVLKEKTVKEDSFSAVRESQAESASRIRDLTSSLQELRGRFDENRYFVEKAMKEAAAERDIMRAQISSIESQLKTLKEKLAGVEGGAKQKEPGDQQSVSKEYRGSRTAGGRGSAGEEGPQDEKTKSYDAAYQAFKENKYREAREMFEAFIKAHPKEDLTDNAQFWIAESYYAEKDYEDAILSYEALLKKFPDSKKTTNALLKQAFAFIEINDAKTGKIILNRLVEKFPDSREAELARKKLAELDKKNTKKK
jgi:tol-pal system protein YbgF